MVSNITRTRRRHPHVFPDGTLNSVSSDSVDQQAAKDNWQAIKQQERQKGEQKILDDVPLALPALKVPQSYKRAASVGFDWADGTCYG